MAATYRRTWVAVIAFVVALGIVGSPHANAGTWPVRTATNATGLAQSLTLTPPSTVTAICAGGLDVRVIALSWTPVEPATSYVVYQSTTSSTSGFSVVATGVTATAWISATLKKATYWYAVATVAGAPTWASPMSPPSNAVVIGTNPRCG